MTTVIKTLNESQCQHQVLVSHKDKHYVVSHSSITTEPKTLIFESDKDGNITSPTEVGSTKDGTVWEVTSDMDKLLIHIAILTSNSEVLDFMQDF